LAPARRRGREPLCRAKGRASRFAKPIASVHLRRSRLRAEEDLHVRGAVLRCLHRRAGYGWQLTEPCFDLARLTAAKDAEIARIEAVYRRMLAESGVRFIAGARPCRMRTRS
jgi:hypothetical protein